MKKSTSYVNFIIAHYVLSPVKYKHMENDILIKKAIIKNKYNFLCQCCVSTIIYILLNQINNLYKKYLKENHKKSYIYYKEIDKQLYLII